MAEPLVGLKRQPRLLAIVRKYKPRGWTLIMRRLKDCDGVTDVEKRCITIERKLKGVDFLAVFLHEVGHVRFQHHKNEPEHTIRAPDGELNVDWREEYEASTYAIQILALEKVKIPLRVRGALKAYVKHAIEAAHEDQLPVSAGVLQWVYGRDYPRQYADQS